MLKNYFQLYWASNFVHYLLKIAELIFGVQIFASWSWLNLYTIENNIDTRSEVHYKLFTPPKLKLHIKMHVKYLSPRNNIIS